MATTEANMNRPALMKILIKIQNCPKYEHQDILTFTGFMSGTEEVAAHIDRNFRFLPKADQAEVLDYAKTLLAA